MRRVVRYSSSLTATGNSAVQYNDLKAKIQFLGHEALLVDMVVSFARQAAQAMKIGTSKTLFPIKITSAAPLHLADKAHRSQDLSYNTARWTVNRSPFVHGRHQDQFEIREYRRDIELYDANEEVIKKWLHYVALTLPAGVGVKYDIYDYAAFKNDE